MSTMAELCRVTSDSHFVLQGEVKLEQHWCRTLTRAPCIFCHICFICFAVSESTISTLASDAEIFPSGGTMLGRAAFQRPQGTVESTNRKFKTAVAEAEDVETSQQTARGEGEEASISSGFAEVLPTVPKKKRAPGGDTETETLLPPRRRAQRELANSLPAQAFWPPVAQTNLPTGVPQPFTGRKASTPDPGYRGSFELGRVNALGYERPWSPTLIAQGKEGVPIRSILPPSIAGRNFLSSPETRVYTEEQRQPGVTEELGRLPPATGRKTLLAAALLYLVGWMSLPWALSAAGIGVFRALRSNRKREAALMRALARSRNQSFQ